ncbi:carboxyl transferase domain-containing protein [Streptomyces sp. ID05-04B]|uniref:carboxyl transferase domain-containing protein n=1 Tax=unclassified Streptomyces TaxID=2593676 RepID=UPI000D1989FB|nr:MULTISPECIES: carboxyl transferase domain-containing protein [unclassified Streptomyces]AVV42777.1 acetyl-CoA carboxylase carboxyl transferase subunit alpha/beta [Streptomyces sp. P3]MDX5570021.1 carboxyl transferase domain-containing protein [Streptomyces sp. ID05-04B]
MTARRAGAREFIALVADGFHELPHVERESRPDGPLGWPGYDASRERAARRTGESESVVCGVARVEGVRAVLIAFEFGFLGGSLGERTGDRLVAAYAYAREHRLPVVPLVATGGSRMQEGMLALTQLQRVARESALTREAGLAQIAVLRDPTTGGGWATLGAGADVVLALPGAQVGFAGSRVRPPDADPAAYTAEAQLAAGAADAVVPVTELRKVLGRWLRLLTGGTPAAGGRPAEPAAPDGPYAPDSATAAAGGAAAARLSPHQHGTTGPQTPDEPAEPLQGHSPVPAEPRTHREEEAAHTAALSGSAPGPQAAVEPAPVPDALGATDLPRTGRDAVRRARAPERPRAQAYLDAYFTDRLAISGDRCGGADPEGMLCGFGLHRGRTVAYAAQTGAATRPAGYRTAARLIRLAGRLCIPVLTLVDTPGAANDAAAERQGAGAAIADLFGAVATARTPLTTLVIGEGGSGGALALAAPGRTWVTPDGYFSVIAPESAAAILKRPPQEVDATADQLRLRPQDLAELGVIRTDRAHGTQDNRAHRP